MIVDLVVRAGVVVAVIMATKHYGIWDSSEHTEELYNSSSEYVEPYAKSARRRLGLEPPQPPPEGKWKFFGVYYYNQAVISVFSLLNTFPTLMGQGLEQVPGYARRIYKSAQEQVEKYREKSVDSNEKSCQGKCIDETPLVQPIEPDSHKETCKPKEKLNKEVQPPPKKRFDDDFIYKSRLPSKDAKRKCNCSKCKRRQEEGWSDNKPKCRNLPSPSDNETDKQQEQQSSKKKICKLCPKVSDETEISKVKDLPKSEESSLKTCKKCLSNKE